MNTEEAIHQLYRLSRDWEDEGLNTKLNQTDINAIGIVCSELDIANKKLDKIYFISTSKIETDGINHKVIIKTAEEIKKEILSIIGGE